MPDYLVRETAGLIQRIRLTCVFHSPRNRDKCSSLLHAAQQLTHKKAAQSLASITGRHLDPLQHALPYPLVQFTDSCGNNPPVVGLCHRYPQVRIINRTGLVGEKLLNRYAFLRITLLNMMRKCRYLTISANLLALFGNIQRFHLCRFPENRLSLMCVGFSCF